MTLHDPSRIRTQLQSVADPVGFLINLFSHAPVGFAVWRADGTTLLTNRAFFDIFLSEPPPEYNVLKDDVLAQNGMLPLFRRAFAGETVHVPTFWYDPRELTSVRVEGGRRVAVSMTIFPLFNADGAVGYVAATYKDETEIRATAERLRRSEEDLRITLHSIGDSVIATDGQGRVTHMNPVAQALTGWSLAEASGRALREVFDIRHETTGEPIEGPIERVLREGVVVGLANHTVLVARDGTERAIADSGAPIRDAEGDIRGVVLVFHDQSEQRAAERAAQRSEARFRRLAEAGILGIIVVDFAGNVLDANDAFLAMVGYTRDELVAGEVRWADMTPPEWRALDELAVAQLKATGAAPAWEKEYVRKDGTRLPILVGVTVLDDDTCIAFILDLTVRKRAEAALRESEARRAAVMEAALDAVVLMDARGVITDFNPAAERTFGCTRDAAVGRLLADVIIPPALRERHRSALARYLVTGEARILGKRVEMPACRSDGTEFPAEVTIVRIRADGPPVFTGYIRDVSERRRAAEAEALRREKEAAEAANRDLEAFSYSVAHDLRAPLRGIAGFTGAFLEDYGPGLDDAARALLARVTANTAHMSQIIDALLSLARLTRQELRPELVDMAAMAKGIVEQLRAGDPRRVVDVHIAEDLVVRADAALLHAALENLLGNAWKFTRHRARAHVEVGRAPGSEDVYFVRDDGAGFDMAHARELFTPFRRLHDASQFEGTGVGLATVARIVQRHGGRIWAEGEVDRGATFFFTLARTPA
jgi:PAS domain S-box-containing protein